jgi:hypothetical protein
MDIFIFKVLFFVVLFFTGYLLGIFLADVVD